MQKNIYLRTRIIRVSQLAFFNISLKIFIPLVCNNKKKKLRLFYKQLS